MLDPAELQLDANPSTNLTVYDKETNELVMVIIHNFTAHPPLLSYMEDITKENVEHCKSMQVHILYLFL